jgi:hypothetical protein
MDVVSSLLLKFVWMFFQAGLICKPPSQLKVGKLISMALRMTAGVVGQLYYCHSDDKQWP